MVHVCSVWVIMVMSKYGQCDSFYGNVHDDHIKAEFYVQNFIYNTIVYGIDEDDPLFPYMTLFAILWCTIMRQNCTYYPVLCHYLL